MRGVPSSTALLGLDPRHQKQQGPSRVIEPRIRSNSSLKRIWPRKNKMYLSACQADSGIFYDLSSLLLLSCDSSSGGGKETHKWNKMLTLCYSKFSSCFCLLHNPIFAFSSLALLVSLGKQLPLALHLCTALPLSKDRASKFPGTPATPVSKADLLVQVIILLQHSISPPPLLATKFSLPMQSHLK